MESLEHVMMRYIEPVLRFCLARLSSREDAEDLSQEILAHVLSGIERYEIKNLDAWIWQVAHNRYARFMNEQMRRFKGETEVVRMTQATNNCDLLEEFVLCEEHRAVFAALHSLAAAYREILVDYYVYRLSVAAIAKKQCISRVTVKWRLHVGRDQIRERVHSMNKVYSRINWHTKTCNGNMDSNRYLYSQVARAICHAAYEKPVSIEEISLATGIPAMFVEDEIPRLVYGDAIVEQSSKYMTNFIVLKLDDNRRLQQILTPYVAKIAALVSNTLWMQKSEIASLGFYGCKLTLDRLGHILVPLIMRTAIERIQATDEKLQYGPYPPRQDGGYGWFIVQETEDDTEMQDAVCTGLNNYRDPHRPEKGYVQYYWLGKYFSDGLNQGLRYFFQQDKVFASTDGRLPASFLQDDTLVRLIRLNLIEQDALGYRYITPIVSAEHLGEVLAHCESLVTMLQHELGSLVLRIWQEFHHSVPTHLHGQINQYVAGYVHRLIGMTIIAMMENGKLAGLPAEGPLPYGVLYVTGTGAD